MAAYLSTLPTLYKRQVMGTHHAGPAYEKYNGMLWFLIQDHTKDDPAGTIIRKFRTSCDGQSSLIELINNYKGDDLKKSGITTPTS